MFVFIVKKIFVRKADNEWVSGSILYEFDVVAQFFKFKISFVTKCIFTVLFDSPNIFPNADLLFGISFLHFEVFETSIATLQLASMCVR